MAETLVPVRMVPGDSKLRLIELKDYADAALQADRLNDAIQAYGEAIQLDPSNEILYSNLSAAHAKNGQYDLALEDAEKAVEIKSAWGKGYLRKGAALCYLKRHTEAIAAYEEGLKHEPNSQVLKDGLAEARNASTAGPRPGFGGGSGFGGGPGFAGGPGFGGGPGAGFPFGGLGGPDAMEKLRNDPRTREFPNQPDFQTISRQMQPNPSALMYDQSSVYFIIAALTVSAVFWFCAVDGLHRDILRT